MRRGLKVEALTQFILEQGALKNLNLMECDKLWTINKKIIYPVYPRHIVPIEERRVLLTLTNDASDPYQWVLLNHFFISFLAIRNMKLEEGEDFLDVLNPRTKIETPAIGDCNMQNLKRGEILQLERKGYYRCDVPFTRPSKPVVLFAIPDGRQQIVLKCLELFLPVSMSCIWLQDGRLRVLKWPSLGIVLNVSEALMENLLSPWEIVAQVGLEM
ncbi:hypothetical protein Patl1_27669 [Pistacia atlantica]|uniref:Uncharacterized protein n=1 Tax=Pistacia atlantica TaxID=434234 RepID=A0ACC1BDY5_9ROSI|nr:hypothetical protein Patl1_27669 [Pistacia atlantica]